MAATDYTFMKSGIITLLVVGSAVAAFGLTFHFFGQSEIVPAPARQFGFWALAPVGIIDKISLLLSGERVYWYPVPMFFTLWISYSLGATALAMLLLNRKEKKQAF
jgi:hypothetical protein